MRPLRGRVGRKADYRWSCSPRAAGAHPCEGRYTGCAMETDPLFYRLFQERPATAFELAGRDMPEGCTYVLRAEELKQTARRMDGVLMPEGGSPDAPLVFTESQFYEDQEFYGRWLSGIFLYLHRHHVTRPWWAMVVFPDRATDVGATAPFASLIQAGQLQRVYLKDLLGEESAKAADPRLGPRLARLVVLDPEHTPAEARALVDAASGLGPEDRHRLVDLIETILVYKLTGLSREEIQQMLHLPETDLKKTRFYQQVHGEGRDEGRDEGRTEEALTLVLRQLKRRIGGATEAQEDRIRALPIDRLEDLAEALLDFRSPHDLEAWLASR
jgi:predicted transposase/invertase (TIGR01784 family)